MTEEACKNVIIRLAEPLAHALGLALWGVEIVRAGRVLVRVYVDVPAPPDGAGDLEATGPADSAAAGSGTDGAVTPALSASLEQCEKISRQLGLALDVEDCFADPYVLEVSTPGLTRVFFSPEQMAPYVGQVVEARLERPLAPEAVGAAQAALPARRVWRGVLRAAEDAALVLAPAWVSQEGEVLPEDLPAVRIPWGAARRVSRMYVFRKPARPGKGAGKGLGKGAGKRPGRGAARGPGKKAGKEQGGRRGVNADGRPEAAPETAAAIAAGRNPG